MKAAEFLANVFSSIEYYVLQLRYCNVYPPPLFYYTSCVFIVPVLSDSPGFFRYLTSLEIFFWLQ